MNCFVPFQNFPRRITRLSSFAAWCLAMAAAVSLVGCGGGSDLPELGKVHGVVTLDGEPLSGAQVQFVPESGRPSSGITDENGRYELQYTADHSGAIVGTHTVKINTAVDGRDDPSTEQMPARYNSESELTEKVEPGSNEINFDLSSG